MSNSPQSPIGVFDSGVGGLSVLRAIRDALPSEHLIYIADSAHAPYGDRDRAFVEARAVALVERLADAGAKAVVVACNTATVIAVERLRSIHRLPIVAMEPAIKPAVGLTRSKVIGVLATTQTLASPSVARLCERHGAGVRILLQPCPGLVERIELGAIDDVETRRLLARYLSPLLAQGVDTLVLGCTHYRFVEPVIRSLVGPDVTIVESAAAVARELSRRLEGNRNPGSGGSERFFSTASPRSGGADALFSRLWGRPVRVEAIADHP